MGLALVEGIPILPNELERTFETHHGMVFRTAYRITGNAADAEDVLQTVFLRLAGRRAGAPDWREPESYLRRAAVNASLDLIRQRRQQAAVPLAPEIAAGGEDRELRDQLRRALATLDARQAEIFALRFFEGYGNAEIAEMLGMSRVLVAVTVHRVRARLEKEMREWVRQA